MTNITSYKGLPLSTFVELQNDDGSTYDPTLYTYDGEIRTYDGTLVETLTVTGTTSADGESGVTVSLSAADSATIDAGIYRYDVLQTTTATSAVQVAFGGEFVQLATVTAP